MRGNLGRGKRLEMRRVCPSYFDCSTEPVNKERLASRAFCMREDVEYLKSTWVGLKFNIQFQLGEAVRGRNLAHEIRVIRVRFQGKICIRRIAVRQISGKVPEASVYVPNNTSRIVQNLRGKSEEIDKLTVGDPYESYALDEAFCDLGGSWDALHKAEAIFILVIMSDVSLNSPI